MMLAAAVFSALITGVYLSQEKTLERNRNLMEQRSLVDVFDLGTSEEMTEQEISRAVEERLDRSTTITDPETGWETTLYKAYDSEAKQSIQAYGFQFRGLGFWAPIIGVLAINPAMDRTVGLTILEQAETPGLGGRITGAEFRRQFEQGLHLTPPDSGEKWLIFTPTPPETSGPTRHVEAITGATQTCNALERILNTHIPRFFRAMQNREAGTNKTAASGHMPAPSGVARRVARIPDPSNTSAAGPEE